MNNLLLMRHTMELMHEESTPPQPEWELLSSGDVSKITISSQTNINLDGQGSFQIVKGDTYKYEFDYVISNGQNVSGGSLRANGGGYTFVSANSDRSGHIDTTFVYSGSSSTNGHAFQARISSGSYDLEVSQCKIWHYIGG